MNKVSRLAVFDLDGTLVDSLGSTVELIQQSVKAITGNDLSAESICEQFGKPEENIFSNFYSEREAKKVMDHYVDVFEKNIEAVQLFVGVYNGLERLSNLGIKMGLYTARGRRTTEIILKNLKLHQFFDIFVTGSEVSNGKPHPEGLVAVYDTAKQIASGQELEISQLVYMGDSHKDILMAKQTGAHSVGVRWCKRCDRVKLNASDPDRVFDEPEKMFEYLETRVGPWK